MEYTEMDIKHIGNEEKKQLCTNVRRKNNKKMVYSKEKIPVYQDLCDLLQGQCLQISKIMAK